MPGRAGGCVFCRTHDTVLYVFLWVFSSIVSCSLGSPLCFERLIDELGVRGPADN